VDLVLAVIAGVIVLRWMPRPTPGK
jgi:hypothetical protein